MNHGTFYAYDKLMCRCDACRSVASARRQRQKERKEQRTWEYKEPRRNGDGYVALARAVLTTAIVEARLGQHNTLNEWVPDKNPAAAKIKGEDLKQARDRRSRFQKELKYRREARRFLSSVSPELVFWCTLSELDPDVFVATLAPMLKRANERELESPS